MAEEFVWKVKNGDLGDIQASVDKGFNIDTEIKGRSPIHYAADYGQLDVIKYLISKGAQINAKDKYGITPLLNAIYEGHAACVEYLLSKGADKSLKAPDGSAYVDCAETDEIKALLK